MKISPIPTLLASAAVSVFALSIGAHADTTMLKLDSPTMVSGIDTACTGVGERSRANPRWSSFPLKVVLAGKGGQFLGDAQLTVRKNGKDLLDVHCGGPWVLLKLDPGTYKVMASLDGTAASSMATVPASGQGRIVLRFPHQGGAITSKHGQVSG